jgi:hypothetical protein
VKKSNNKIYFEFTICFPCDEPHSTVSLTQNCKCNHLDGTQTLICGKSLYPKFANAQTAGSIPFLQWTNLLPRMGSHKKKGKMDTSPLNAAGRKWAPIIHLISLFYFFHVQNCCFHYRSVLGAWLCGQWPDTRFHAHCGSLCRCLINPSLTARYLYMQVRGFAFKGMRLEIHLISGIIFSFIWKIVKKLEIKTVNNIKKNMFFKFNTHLINFPRYI